MRHLLALGVNCIAFCCIARFATDHLYFLTLPDWPLRAETGNMCCSDWLQLSHLQMLCFLGASFKIWRTASTAWRMEDLLSDSELVNAYAGCGHTTCRGGAQCCKGSPGTCSEQTYGSSLACAARAVFRDLAQRQAGDGPAEWCDAGENAGASQTAAIACEGMLSAHIP